jgi:undecaprenyl-diphosphatase
VIDLIVNIDKELFLFLNGFHNSFFDFLMFWISSSIVWIPLYLFFAFLLFKVYNRGFWLPLISVILIVGLADLASVELFKNVFERLRPCHNPEFDGIVHLVNNKCGGRYSFVSSHAANMFSLATSLWFFIRVKYPKSFILLAFWAALIGYSRIYLGVHFPADVVGGSFLGILVGYLGFKIYNLLPCGSPNRNSCSS